MFRHLGHRQVGFWGLEEKHILCCNVLLGKLVAMGNEISFYSTMRGCLCGLGMANARWYQCVVCWPVSTASSWSVLWMALVGWSMCGSSQGNFVGFFCCGDAGSGCVEVRVAEIGVCPMLM
jgi:hypothetical protein